MSQCGLSELIGLSMFAIVFLHFYYTTVISIVSVHIANML